MKKNLTILLSFCFLLATFYSLAQVPQKFNYQGIARDAKGNPMAQQKMSLKISVLPTSDATIPEYEEIQNVNTNEFGLYNLQIGAGTAVTGEMKSVKWETGNKYIRVAIDPKGGSDFVDAGTNQLLSVPYAIYADKAGIAKNGGNGDRTGSVSSNATHVLGDVNFLTKFTGLNQIGKSQLFDNGTNVGIGTTSPLFKFHVQSATGNADIFVRSLDGGAASSMRLRNSSGAELGINKFGSAATGTFMGLPRANMAAVNNFTTGPFVFNSGSDIVFGNSVGATQLPRMFINGATGNVGIGTGVAAPTARLEVAGQVKIKGGSPATGKVLTSDSTGLATWQNPKVASAKNGLSKVQDSLVWGGRLTQSTQINQDGKIISFTDTSGSNTISISQLASTTVSALSGTARTQTFTASQSNFVHSIDLKLTGIANTTVTLELRNSVGAILGSKAINFPALYDSLVTFAMPKPLINIGEVYTLRVTGSTGSNWYINGTNVLVGGQASTSPSQDFTFRVRSMEENAIVSFSSGNIQASSLTGSGNRIVYADSQGVLTTELPLVAIPSQNNSTIQSIPDASCTGITSTILISGSPTSIPSNSLQVTLDILHTFVGDLRIYLVSPGNDTLTLAKQNGGSGNNYSNTIFSDLGTTNITQVASTGAPFSGIFKPNGSTVADNCGRKGTDSTFGTLGGGSLNPNGVWSLVIIDNSSVDIGTLNSWSISTEPLTENFFPKWEGGVLSTSSALYQKNGNIGVNTLSPLAKMHIQDGILVSGNFGIGDTVAANGSGALMFFNPRKGAFRAGQVSGTQWDNINIGSNSIATGFNTIASGSSSSALGNGTQANGITSTAIGSNTLANGSISTAMGFSTQANGSFSTAMGGSTRANGSFSTAMGNGSITNGFSSLVIGQFNDTLVASQTVINSTTPLFIIGNGTASNVRSNVMVVKNDGRVGIGTNFPATTLDVNGDLKIGSSETFVDSGANLLALVNASFIPNTNGTRTLGSASHRWSTVFASNGTINTSDARDKTNINDISYGLATLMQMRPVSFQWKNKEAQGAKLGFLAQDLQKILPEVVADKEFVTTDELTGKGEWKPMDRLGVYYSDIIPVLTKAIQEQQVQIEELKKQNELLIKRLDALEKK